MMNNVAHTKPQADDADRRIMTKAPIGYSLLVAQWLVLSACVPGGDNAYRVGPLTEEATLAQTGTRTQGAAQRLNVVVPVFDPGLSEDAEDYEEEDVWPEVRRAEANRFAVKMKQALEQTGAFGAVRVAPDAQASGELYVLGKIIQSNGLEVEIQIEVFDVSGKRWLGKKFSHEVGENYYENIANKSIRNNNKQPDAYDPVFEEAAESIAELLRRQKPATVRNLNAIAELRFGNYLTDGAFSDHLAVEKNLHILNSLPSDDDTMLKRVRAARVREQLFVDDMQSAYTTFSSSMEDSYFSWQEASHQALIARNEAERKALWKKIGAAAALAATVVGAAAAVNKADTSYNPAAQAMVVGAVASGVAALALFESAGKSKEEAKLLQEELNELGADIDMELAPSVMEMEGQSTQLQGDAREQFAQWRAFLKKIHEQERTPEIIL